MNRELRDSGVGWLGTIPAEWPIVPARALFGERKSRSSATDVHLTPSQKYGVLPQAEYMEITGNRVVLNLSGADNMRHVEAGDYVSHLRSFQGGLEYAGIPGKVSAAYTVLKPKVPLDARFFRYLFKSDLYVQALQTTTDQLRDGQSIRYSQFSLIPLPNPGLEEQRAIADYLDRDTAQIDAFTAKNEELIALLTERRATVIDKGVFGLDDEQEPPIRRVPDFVEEHAALHEFVRRTPANWEIGRFKAVTRRRDARNKDGRATMRSLKTTGEVVTRTSQQNPDESSIPRYLLVEPNDLVVNPMWLVGGAIGVSTRNGAVSPDYRVFRPRAVVWPRFLHHVLRSRPYRAQYDLFTRAETTFDRRVSQRDLDRLPIPLPSLGEQMSIALSIDDELANIEATLEVVQRAVELARERRSALISAAVTGKTTWG